MLDLRRLKILREVALSGSFSAAATRLSFSPSAISQQIAALERETGTSLVDRRSNGVVLTQAGRVLVSHANAMLARMADAEEELRQLVSGMAGTLRVGSFATAAATLMPEAIVTFRDAHPRVEVTLIEHESAAAREALLRGELDLALVLRFGHEPVTPPHQDVEQVPLLDENMHVLLPMNHRLATRPAVALEELDGESWVDGSSQNTHHTLAQAGITPNVVFRSDDFGVVQGIVASSVAICFLPGLALGTLRRDVIVKPIVPMAPVRHVEIAARADDYRPRAVRAMIDVLHQVTERYCTSRVAGSILDLRATPEDPPRLIGLRAA